jgi:tetratricopeptide (TPR) repeat protein
MAGKFETSRNLLAEARGLANELGSEPALAMLGWRAGSVELLAGDPAAAEREFRPAVAVYERTKNWGILMSLAPRLATALIALGRDDEAFELSELGERLSVPEDVDAQAGWRCIRADILARRGDHSESERFARQAIEIAEPTDYLDLRATATATLGTVLELSGCAKEAATEKAEAAKLWNQKGNVAAVARMQNKRSL